ncbi:MAG: hypothetical protein AB1894_15780 [Chloroflexota bacterium]
MDFYQDFIIQGDGFFDILEPEDIWRSILGINNCFQVLPPIRFTFTRIDYINLSRQKTRRAAPYRCQLGVVDLGDAGIHAWWNNWDLHAQSRQCCAGRKLMAYLFTDYDRLVHDLPHVRVVANSFTGSPITALWQILGC